MLNASVACQWVIIIFFAVVLASLAVDFIFSFLYCEHSGEQGPQGPSPKSTPKDGSDAS